MSPETTFQTFVRDALGRIEIRIESFGERILTLEIKQKSILNGHRDTKALWMRVVGAIIVVLIVTVVSVIFGKSL